MSNQLPSDISDVLFDILEGLSKEDLTVLDALGEIKDVLEGFNESYCELERNNEAFKKEILRQQEQIEILMKHLSDFDVWRKLSPNLDPYKDVTNFLRANAGENS